MEIMRRSGPNNPLNNADQTAFPKPPAPWWNVTRPHPGSSGLSRFRENAPVLSATNATPIALNVYQARCEIKADSINTPVRIFSSFSGTDCILSIPSMGGWKDRTPVLQYIINAESTGSTEHHTVDESFTVGLEAIAYHSAIDPSRKLLFVGDSDRIKSFEWGKPETDGNYHKKAKAAHTLDSDELDGPMIVIGDGRFMRAGQGKIGVWNLNDLTEETHAKLGKKPIGGRKISIEDSWRDDPEDIERSWGTAVGQTIKLWLPNLNPGVMAHHPSGTANLVLLAAQYDRGNSHSSDPVAQYSCVALDIERGKPVSKILGHGDIVAEFSTSRADPNVFATGCGDGYVRLFDVRTHFPVITFDATERDDECGALALTHPDGIPSLFTGSSRGETIKFWDIRAQAVVYDLGTGNNAVSSLAWDEHRRTLYAAAPCEHVTRHGDRVDYRKLQVPKPPKNAKQQRNREAEGDGEDDAMDEDNDPEWEDGDDDEGEYEYGNYAGRGWPKKAQHGEDYYPHLFDAASHRLFRYTFKTDPNPDAVPVCD
ncbi:WD40 repeat-like protein [Pluteus cervinus]|uniref:WD40 repeat-like protein n=1 Tax=Pluteus cervinus TaxID=181527 RepID=A0ACD3AS84_9AGAR|nr:WD40 repeat-like protein [Pluteus cervinus]